MKIKLIIPVTALLFLACGQSKSDREGEERNSKEHVESTEEDISPNLEKKTDTGSRLYVDTVSSAESIEKKRNEDSLWLDTKQ